MSQLVKLRAKFIKQPFDILVFPCNQFGGQMPGSNADVKAWLADEYPGALMFNVFAKLDVNGPEAHELFRWIKSKISKLGMSRVKWNFEKFLISADGQVAHRYNSTTKPNSLISDIEALLARQTIEPAADEVISSTSSSHASDADASSSSTSD